MLPFNAAEGTKPAFGRQMAAFAAEQLRAHADADINVVSFLTQIEDQEGPRTAYVNISDELLPYDQLKDLFEQAEVDLVMDGYLAETEGEFKLIIRFHTKASEIPSWQEEHIFKADGVFAILHGVVKVLAAQGEVELPEFLAGETMEFGTVSPESFLNFLEGYDALNYINQANGAVAREFNPETGFETLLKSVEIDPTFEGPYHVAIQLGRACAHFRIGTFELVDESLRKLTELVPNHFGAYFALGEVHQTVGSLNVASENYEKAIQREPNDPNLYSRLGLIQGQLGMPVNAERNFRKALELEGDDKPSADFLANVLQETNRGHEVPSMYQTLLEKTPTDPVLLSKYATSLVMAERAEEGEKAFESALEIAEDNTAVKRYYAPYLAQKGEHDRAMDFYEDCIEVAPQDVQLLIEFVNVLESAGRQVDIPDVLKQIIAANPEPNIRAQTLARLIELEQPKRAESVELARTKMEAEDFEGAIRDLKPLRNWLADYWKLWALLSAAYNRTERFEEAEDCARRLLNLFPGCEPAYGELTASLTAQGRNDEAYDLMRYAAVTVPGSPSILINLGLAAKRAGHIEEARDIAKQLREALGNNEDLVDVLREMES